ncbi:PQQ-binding-like beta-propeller repeat protein (plasmid) [Haladaptatus sp. SPP-AMP-3]|uniref:outer membrane protein assembly factor BamB family protein n=1 Tax=Haladaptatus sp. SPP-AMP-3 TaxID=3121295 RepID=UPI003C2C31B8
MVGRSSRRDFLRISGLGLSVIGSGCSALQAQSPRRDPRWSVEFDGTPARATTLSDGGLVIATTFTPDGELGHLRFSGEYQRLAELIQVKTPPVVYDHRALVESEGIVRAVALDGSSQTRLRTGYLALGHYAPVVSGSSLFGVGYSDEFGKYVVFALDLAAERIRWLRPFGTVRASIAADGERVFAASPSGVVRAYHADDGATLWRCEIGKGARLTHRGDSVLVATRGGMTALDATDGSIRWQTESSWIASVDTVPAVTDSTVYAVLSLYSNHRRTVFETETYLIAFHLDTGVERWRTRVNYGTPLTVTEDGIVAETMEKVETDRGNREFRKNLSVFATGGKRLTKYDLPDRATMRPVLLDDAVVAGYGKTVAAYDR